MSNEPLRETGTAIPSPLITESCGNVFEDLGFPKDEAAELLKASNERIAASSGTVSASSAPPTTPAPDGSCPACGEQDRFDVLEDGGRKSGMEACIGCGEVFAAAPQAERGKMTTAELQQAGHSVLAHKYNDLAECPVCAKPSIDQWDDSYRQRLEAALASHNAMKQTNRKAERGETAETPERTLRSLAVMLGWMNVPPRHIFEAEIRAMKARIATLRNAGVELLNRSEKAEAELAALKAASSATAPTTD